MDQEKAEIMQKTAKQIKYFRTIRGLSQETLALSAGLNPAYLGQIERCLKCPTIDTINKIALALDVTLSELFCFDSNPKTQASNEAIDRIAYSIRNLSKGDAQQIAEIVVQIVKLKQESDDSNFKN